MSDCQCPVAGWCDTYRRKMTPLQREVCRGERLTPEKCEAQRETWRQRRDGELDPVPVSLASADGTTTTTTPSGLRKHEVAKLFPGIDDPTLLGNRIAALTKAIGIPPCGGCAQRRDWLNRAELWLRGQSN